MGNYESDFVVNASMGIQHGPLNSHRATLGRMHGSVEPKSDYCAFHSFQMYVLIDGM